ncbi:MAG: hypothetical protein ACSHX6_11920 [Akkermansiaceae bacterium]
MNKILVIISLCLVSLSQINAADKKLVLPEITSDLDSLIEISKYLSGNITQVKDCKFIRCEMSYETHGYQESHWRYGWRDKRGIIYFLNGSTSHSTEFEIIDFKKHCNQRFELLLKKKITKDMIFESAFNFGEQELTPALAAIMLYRTGNIDDARTYWKHTVAFHKAGLENNLRNDDTPIDPWRHFLGQLGGSSPWALYRTAVETHSRCRSDIALDLLIRLNKLDTEALTRFGNGERFLADLQRRKNENAILEASHETMPKELANWESQKRMKFLISKLDQVNEIQNGQPGGVDLASDWRVYELIKLGDAAIPDLIDCLESDDRLTRSFHYWRLHHNSRTILSVKESALTAIMCILQEPLFEAASTGSSFTSQEAGKTKELVKKLRNYWGKHGRTERTQRFMNRLADREASDDRRLDALQLLAWSDYEFTSGTTFSTGNAVLKSVNNHEAHPLLDRFNNPTLAEAIWLFAQELLERGDFEEVDNRIYCFNALAKVRDPRIIPELAKAYQKESSILPKLLIATTINSCGDPSQVKDFAQKFDSGEMLYGNSELVTIINKLVKIRNPSCELALNNITVKNHQLHRHYKNILKGLLDNKNPFRKNDSFLEEQHINWKNHLFAIKMLINELDNKTATKKSIQVQGRNILTSGDSYYGWEYNEDIDWLNTQPHNNEIVTLRICDIAAMRLQDIVLDLPPYSPLLINRDTALNQLHQALKSHPIKELPEKYALHLGNGDHIRRYYLAPPSAITRPATKEDVSQRKAYFHFEGRGKLLPLQLPIFTYLLKENNILESCDYSNPVIILQAEQGPSGETTYGCLTSHGTGVFYLDEVKLP